MVRDLVPTANARAVVPYAFAPDGGGAREPPAEARIIFVAGFGHAPNRDAAVWFAREVMPAIRARCPEARLTIAGSDPVPEVVALRGPSVELAANIGDAALDRLYRSARVAVVPLLAGAGVKRKTVEALWHGLPAVLTPVGAQGLPDVETIVPVSAAAGDFAAHVCRLLTDDALWRRQSAAQRAYAQERFSEAAARRSLLAALDFRAEQKVGGAVREHARGFAS